MNDFDGLELQEQMMTQLEEMQVEIDQYEQTIANLQGEAWQKDLQICEALSQAESWKEQAEEREKQIQRLLSEKQELVSTVAEQGKRIAEQAETQSELTNTKKKYSLALSNLEKLNSQLEQARLSANSSEVSQLKEAISELRKDNQQKSETIKSLNERIGTLSESDNVLKQNAELKLKNSELQRMEQKARQEAEDRVSSVKREYANKQAELEKKIASADYRERQASTLEANLSRRADERAQKLAETRSKALRGEYEAHRKSLVSEYEALIVRYRGVLLGCLLYGVMVTLFTAVRSEVFISDFKVFFVAIGRFLMLLVNSLISLGDWASQLGDMIPQPIVALLVHWLLWILACIGIAIGFVVLLIIGLFRWFKWFKKNQADLIALSVFLVSLALIIFFPAVFKAFLPVNLLWLLLWVQIVAMGIRAYIQSCKRNRRYYY